MKITWNPKTIPDDEDAVVLTAHQHTKHPTMILGAFRSTRQDGPLSAAFTVSDFSLPFRDAFAQAKAHAQQQGIVQLYIVDPYGLGSMLVRE